MHEAQLVRVGEKRSAIAAAWTLASVRAALAGLIAVLDAPLPADRDARIVLKPNLNNDLNALTGNSADLRVLVALIEHLKDAGYRQLVLADGSNVGVERRGISTFKRLRIDKLALRYGLELVDLNHDDAHRVVLHGGAHPLIARTVLEADFYISVPKIKTHAEARLSCALKNQVGLARGQDKRHMHRDLARNIFALAEVVSPDLVLVDGLVAMEGNGPGDGDPARFERLVLSDDPWLNDVVVCQLAGISPDTVPYLVHGIRAGRVSPEMLEAVRQQVATVRRLAPPPQRGRLARISELPALHWAKVAARPLTQQPAVSEAAYRMGVIQDVYRLEDDGIREVVRQDGPACEGCDRCVQVCPAGLPLDQIGTEPEACLECLYCWWVCPAGLIELVGPLGFLEQQAARYKAALEAL